MIRSVCIVSREYPPDTGYGGIARVAEMTARALVERGIAVHVISFSPSGVRTRILLSGVAVHRLGGSSSLSRTVRTSTRRSGLRRWPTSTASSTPRSPSTPFSPPITTGRRRRSSLDRRLCSSPSSTRPGPSSSPGGSIHDASRASCRVGGRTPRARGDRTASGTHPAGGRPNAAVARTPRHHSTCCPYPSTPQDSPPDVMAASTRSSSCSWVASTEQRA